MNMELRNAIEYDVEEAYKLFKPLHENVCYSELDPTMETKRTPFITSKEAFIETLKDTNIFFIVLKETEEKVIGYIILPVFNSGIAQIKEIMIAPELKQHGYGKKAVKLLIEGLREDETISIIKVFSATIATDNFYSACNFRFTSGDTYEFKLR